MYHDIERIPSPDKFFAENFADLFSESKISSFSEISFTEEEEKVFFQTVALNFRQFQHNALTATKGYLWIVPN